MCSYIDIGRIKVNDIVLSQNIEEFLVLVGGLGTKSSCSKENFEMLGLRRHDSVISG